MKPFDVAWDLLAGTDGWDSSAVQWTDDLNNLYKDDPAIVNAMRQATHRILYPVANSNAMNGFNAETEIVAVTLWWQTALHAVDTLVAVGCAACVVMLVRAVLRKNKAKKSQAN